MLEVLQLCPSQKKYLLTALGAVDPLEDHLIVFPVDASEHPPLPPSVAFQILVWVCNAIISRCIINEGASTYVMSATIWKNLKSPKLSPSTITLSTWDSHPSQPLGMYHNCPVTLAVKIVHVDIEVIDVPLDYNILLGCIYTYAMLAATSAVFSNMCYPMKGRLSLSISWHTTSYIP